MNQPQTNPYNNNGQNQNLTTFEHHRRLAEAQIREPTKGVIPPTTAHQVVYPYTQSIPGYDINLFQPSFTGGRVLQQDILMINRGLEPYFMRLYKKRCDPIIPLIMIIWLIATFFAANALEGDSLSVPAIIFIFFLMVVLTNIRSKNTRNKLVLEAARAQNLMRGWNQSIFEPRGVTLVIGPRASFILFSLNYKFQQQQNSGYNWAAPAPVNIITPPNNFGPSYYPTAPDMQFGRGIQQEENIPIQNLQIAAPFNQGGDMMRYNPNIRQQDGGYGANNGDYAKF